MHGRHVHTMINVWNKYGEPRSYGNGETCLITKTTLLMPEKQWCNKSCWKRDKNNHSPWQLLHTYHVSPTVCSLCIWNTCKHHSADHTRTWRKHIWQ